MANKRRFDVDSVFSESEFSSFDPLSTTCHNTIQWTIPIQRAVEVSDNDTGWRE